MEGLGALQRDADRIGVVAMRLVGVAGDGRLDALHANKRRIVQDMLAGAVLAQTFKTGHRLFP